MRDFEFRAKDSFNMWVFGSLLTTANDVRILRDGISIQVKSETVCQSTGFKAYDKGKIFECDILSHNGMEFVVKFINGCFCVVSNMYIEPLRKSFADESKIVGNIFDGVFEQRDNLLEADKLYFLKQIESLYINKEFVDFVDWCFKHNMETNLSKDNLSDFLYKGLFLFEHNGITIFVDAISYGAIEVSIDPTFCFSSPRDCSVKFYLPLKSDKKTAYLYKKLDELFNRTSSLSKEWFSKASELWDGGYLNLSPSYNKLY